ncbi:RHS repeat-associated core domain-containing protein [Methyloversatilis sp.]|uniref:RHS repeat-associated core domain-containing protein n=1 Tax=Methyloversatilis sp. TaxID=2569862 RepID=UPI0035B025F2
MVLALSGAVRADSYEYDELGNLKTLSSPRGTRTYSYDEIQRLDTETGYTGDRDHAYDLNGNRTTDGATAPGTPTTATYTSNTNRIATINGAAVTLDAAGQITNDGLNSYTWDDAGRLKTVSRGGQLRATYHYDYKHRRTRKVTTAAAPQGAQTVVYHYDDQDRLIAETTQTGTPLRSYAWSDENLIGQVEYVANATNTGYEIGRIVYYELDHLGTPRQARERTGTVVWRWESDGYGNTAADEDPDGNGQKTYVYLRFPGQYFDEESGLHYNWHRYYVPRLGRYLSSDPIGVEGGGNTYGYVEGNPLRYTDSMGLYLVNPGDNLGPGGGLSPGGGGRSASGGAGGLIVLGGVAVNAVINAVKEWCSDAAKHSPEDCLKFRDQDEARCDKDFNINPRVHSGCYARAFERYRACLTGAPDPGPWTDASVDGWQPPKKRR